MLAYPKPPVPVPPKQSNSEVGFDLFDYDTRIL